MKKEAQYIIWAHVALVVFLFWYTFDLITLIHDDTSNYALLDYELNPHDGKLERPQIIPKIIHQTFKTEEIPDIWKPGQRACVDLHPEYQYILWTDEMARQFIAEEYPWFIPTWDSYPYPIQRADAIRYFALLHYGGIYIDLDDGCERKLDPLLTVPAFVRKTVPTGISNDVMGSVARHPFFVKVVDSLARYKHNWLIPYLTIMYSTGPLFLLVILKQYNRWGNVPEAGKVRVLMPEDYKSHPYLFFAIAPGSSWHLDDAKFIKLLANHIGLAVFCGFLIAFAVFALEFLLYTYVTSGSFKRLRKLCAKPIMSVGKYFLLNTKSFGFSNMRNMSKRRSRKDSNLPQPNFEKDDSVVDEDSPSIPMLSSLTQSQTITTTSNVNLNNNKAADMV